MSINIKTKFGMATALGLSLMGTHAQALQGSATSGGGNILVASFVSYTQALLNSRFMATAQDRALLLTTLQQVKIESVKTLIDQDTHQAVPDQEKLVAWGSPGLIQLKEQTPGADSWEQLFNEHKPVAHFAVHELYRAAGLSGSDGKSVDDSFQLSVGKLHLDQVPATAAELGEPAINDGTLVLTGYFPTTNIEDSFVKSVIGFGESHCTSDHHSGFEGFALNFTCISAKALIQGRASVNFVGSDTNREFTWNIGPTLQFFEGPNLWANNRYTCHRLGLESFACDPTGDVGPSRPTFKQQYDFSLTEYENHSFALAGATTQPIPCQVQSLGNAIKINCWSLDGVFVGQTRNGGTSPWDIDGELSLFSGPGNFLRMQSNCLASTSEIKIPGNGSILKLNAKCVRPGSNPTDLELGGFRNP